MTYADAMAELAQYGFMAYHDALLGFWAGTLPPDEAQAWLDALAEEAWAC